MFQHVLDSWLQPGSEPEVVEVGIPREIFVPGEWGIPGLPYFSPGIPGVGNFTIWLDYQTSKINEFYFSKALELLPLHRETKSNRKRQ